MTFAMCLRKVPPSGSGRPRLLPRCPQEAGRPRAQAMAREAGFDVLSMDVSEFEKCEGALTCLSLLF